MLRIEKLQRCYEHYGILINRLSTFLYQYRWYLLQTGNGWRCFKPFTFSNHDRFYNNRHKPTDLHTDYCFIVIVRCKERNHLILHRHG